MISRLIILFSFVLFVHFSFGQQKIDWAKYDQAAFKEDTTFGFLTRFYYKAKYHVPSFDITTSDAILELRVVPSINLMEGLMNLPIRIFQFYKDSTVLTEYFQEPDTIVENFAKKYRDSSAEAYMKGVTPLVEKTGGMIWKVNKKMLSQSEAFNVITELTKRNLFTVDVTEEIEKAEKRIKTDPQFFDIIKTYQLIQGPLTHNRKLIVFEIKYKNKYRIFRTGQVSFYYYDSGNRMEFIEVFKVGSELVKYLMPDMKM